MQGDNGKDEEKAAVYQNRRRIRGERGKRVLRQRRERVERTFAHMYETGGIRRTHLRYRDNIAKRLLIHASAFNLGLVMRTISGYGTPRGLQGRIHQLLLFLLPLVNAFIPHSWRSTAQLITSRKIVTSFRLADLWPNSRLLSTQN